jgi:CRP-like cAMP-binding protein
LFEKGSDGSGLPAFCDRKYLPGQYLIERGRTPERIITVIDGLAVIEANDLSTGEYKSRLLFPLEVVGLVEMLAGRPATYNVIASTECTVRSITRMDLFRHIAERPELRSRVVRLLADLVRDADRLLKQL